MLLVCARVLRDFGLLNGHSKPIFPVHTDWLSQHLMNTCPNHEQDIRTPNQPLNNFKRIGLKKLVPELTKHSYFVISELKKTLLGSALRLSVEPAGAIAACLIMVQSLGDFREVLIAMRKLCGVGQMMRLP
jgi:hypothetical protein